MKDERMGHQPICLGRTTFCANCGAILRDGQWTKECAAKKSVKIAKKTITIEFK